MQAHVEHAGRNVLRARKQFVAAPRVRLDDVELFGRELAGLVEDLLRHERLAEIVEHSRKARLATLRLVEPDLAPERDHQRAHRDGVHVGVFVRGLQTRETAERIRMPIDRFGDVVDERRCTRRYRSPCPCALRGAGRASPAPSGRGAWSRTRLLPPAKRVRSSAGAAAGSVARCAPAREPAAAHPRPSPHR